MGTGLRGTVSEVHTTVRRTTKGGCCTLGIQRRSTRRMPIVGLQRAMIHCLLCCFLCANADHHNTADYPKYSQRMKYLPERPSVWQPAIVSMGASPKGFDSGNQRKESHHEFMDCAVYHSARSVAGRRNRVPRRRRPHSPSARLGADLSCDPFCIWHKNGLTLALAPLTATGYRSHPPMASHASTTVSRLLYGQR
jgi:hypothetical protein